VDIVGNRRASFIRCAQLRGIYSQRGGVLVLVVVVIAVLIQLVAFAVDIGSAYTAQRHIHIGTDAGALAGVGVFAKVPAAVNSLSIAQANVVPETREVALANGIKDAELIAGGGIVVGNWNRNTLTFTPEMTPLNAVSVGGRRDVAVFFGRIMGWSLLQPGVRSIAAAGGAGTATCLIPFGLDDDVLVGKDFGDVLDISHPSPGNWGKLDIGGNMSALPNFIDGMINGACGTSVSVDDPLSPGTGFAGVKQGFDGRIEINPIVIIPIVDHFGLGNSVDSNVVGFIVAELIAQIGNGSKWSGDIRFLDESAGTGIGGPNQPPFAKSRVLVQ